MSANKKINDGTEGTRYCYTQVHTVHSINSINVHTISRVPCFISLFWQEWRNLHVLRILIKTTILIENEF